MLKHNNKKNQKFQKIIEYREKGKEMFKNGQKNIIKRKNLEMKNKKRSSKLVFYFKVNLKNN